MSWQLCVKERNGLVVFSRTMQCDSALPAWKLTICDTSVLSAIVRKRGLHSSQCSLSLRAAIAAPTIEKNDMLKPRRLASVGIVDGGREIFDENVIALYIITK